MCVKLGRFKAVTLGGIISFAEYVANHEPEKTSVLKMMPPSADVFTFSRRWVISKFVLWVIRGGVNA